MEQEMIVAENISQLLVFLLIDVIIAIVVYGIVYLYIKYGKKNEVLNKFVSMPLVQNLLIDIKYIIGNIFKLKAKQQMKKHKIGEDSEADQVIPQELIKKYGEGVKNLSKESIEKLKEMENKNQST